MCTKVIHKYGCGHQLVDTAPCAGLRSGACKGVNEKVVSHTEKCDRICGGWWVARSEINYLANANSEARTAHCKLVGMMKEVAIFSTL